jgi:hypothetical protein
MDIQTITIVNKHKIVSQIKDTKWSGRWICNVSVEFSNKLWLFWIETDVKCKRFNCVFCIKCGNYLKLDTPATDDIICICITTK